MLLLAGDIGGTNSRFALYRGGEKVFERTFPSAEHASFEAVVERLLEEASQRLGADARPERACIGVAGPVENDTSKVTNLPWFIDARRLEQRFKIARVSLLNDFQAAALGVSVLGGEHLVQIGGGARVDAGPCAVMGAGTGLGQAFLVWSAGERRYQVVSSEGGHVDFPPRTPLESALFQYLAAHHDRVDVERVLSGPGLANVFEFLASEPACRPLIAEETRAAMEKEDRAAVITRQALAGRDPICALAVHLFASVLGAVAGNLALTVLATGGVFIAGGIAPRIASILQQGAFRAAFEAKGLMQPLVTRIPVFLVTHKELGLLGAMVEASRL